MHSYWSQLMATRLGRYVRGRTHFPYCPRYTGFNRVLYHGCRVRNQVLRISANVGCGNVADWCCTRVDQPHHDLPNIRMKILLNMRYFVHKIMQGG